MGKPIVHAKSSAKRFGGKASDYLDIHEFIDSSRQAFSDLRHRALTHNSWFITHVLPRVFGRNRTNSAGVEYDVTEVAEHHILEDYRGKFIPTAQDFLQQIVWVDWMENGKQGRPPSARVPSEPAESKGLAPAKTTLNKNKKGKLKIIIPEDLMEVKKKPAPEYPLFERHPCNFD